MSVFWAFSEAGVAVGECVLSGDESRHLGARRLRPGDPMVVFDGRGGMGEARLVEATKRAARVEIASVEHVPAPSEGPVIASAAPKGDRLSMMLQMLSQLGARVWQPIVLEHSVVRRVVRRRKQQPPVHGGWTRDEGGFHVVHWIRGGPGQGHRRAAPGDGSSS